MGYQQLQDHYKFPPLEAMSLLAETTQSVLKNGSRAEIDLEELEDATGQVEAYLDLPRPKVRPPRVECRII